MEIFINKNVVAILFVLLYGIGVSAHDFEESGIYYNKISSSSVKVTYKGDTYTSYSDEYSGDLVIPDVVTHNDHIYSIERIDEYAFAGCKNLTSISISDKVLIIGSAAFMDCKNLQSIKLPKSIRNIEYLTFCGCAKLPNITIPDKVLRICDWAFGGCTALQNLTLSPNLSEVGEYAFYDCAALKDIEIPKSVVTLGMAAFANCI